MKQNGLLIAIFYNSEYINYDVFIFFIQKCN